MLYQIFIKDKLLLWRLFSKMLKYKGIYILSLLNIKLRSNEMVITGVIIVI